MKTKQINYSRSNLIAIMLYKLGKKPTYSTDIVGELSCGYGKLDDFGFFRYKLFFKTK